MTTETNKAIVTRAFDALFNHKDFATAEALWSPGYIQHSAFIAPGREGLFDLVRAAPADLRHEVQAIVAEGDLVMVHGRFTGHGRPRAWIATDIVRMENGLLAEHWDVLQDEVTGTESASGLPMFGATFPLEVGNDTTSVPGKAWFDIIKRETPEAFADAFTADVSLHASVCNAPLEGVAAISHFFSTTRTMFEGFTFTRETHGPNVTFLDWEATYHGLIMTGITILDDADGRICRITTFYGPHDQAFVFARDLAARLTA